MLCLSFATSKGCRNLKLWAMKTVPANLVWKVKKPLEKKNAGKMYSAFWKQSVHKLLSCSVAEEREQTANTGQIHRWIKVFGGRLIAMSKTSALVILPPGDSCFAEQPPVQTQSNSRSRFYGSLEHAADCSRSFPVSFTWRRVKRLLKSRWRFF